MKGIMRCAINKCLVVASTLIRSRVEMVRVVDAHKKSEHATRFVP